jgi:hypothetical protein
MKYLYLMVLLALLSVARVARAQDAVIKFAPGSSPATIKGHVNPLSNAEYKLVVSASQRVAIRLTSTSRKKLVRFDIKRDRFTGKPLPGADNATDWEGVFEKGGDYWIPVFALPDAGEEDFTLEISSPAEERAEEGGAAGDVRFDAGKVPATGARPQDFVPSGWKIAAHVEGDLNGDGRTDHALQLVNEETPDERSVTDSAPEAHALLILLADGGNLRRAGLATMLLAPIVPQYSLDMKIRSDGVLVVMQDYGMSDVVSLKHLFRYEPRTGRFLLIGRDVFIYTRPLRDDTVKTSENYLNGSRVITTGHFRRNAETVRETTKREQMERQQIYLEEVDEDPVH